jgi:single-stranded-DNA-specific exonuclease
MGLDGDIAGVADEITGNETVTVVSHIDADGIASEAILTQALSRAGIPTRSVFIRQLEPLTIHQIPRDGSLKVFLDLGAGQQQLLAEHQIPAGEVVIIDHHVAQPCGTAYLQVNALSHGHAKLSAAGMAYLVARKIEPSCADLSKLAVIGNVGDMMAREEGRLTGPAREIVEDGVACGCIEVRRGDLGCYGTATRPLHLCLAYSDDPFITGISNNTTGAIRFLRNLRLPAANQNGHIMYWDEMPHDSKREIMSALVQHMLAHGDNPARLFSETYHFPGEPARTELRNAQEFATLLNACGRWAKPSIGSAVCRGDRGVAYREAKHMLTNHRAVIRDLLQYILDTGVHELPNLQYIHVGNRYPDTVVGIGAGMALSRLNPGKPILIMCHLPEDPTLTKVSMRANEQMVSRGIDLQAVLATASGEIGGAGGGHRIAAGAYIRKADEEVFLERINELLERDAFGSGPRHC